MVEFIGKRAGLGLSVLVAGLLLAGCGGGGGGDSGTSTSTGVFSDAPVAGLSYTTSSGLSGTTDGQGHYNYHAGDTVTFKLGGITLGTLTAGALLTPDDVAAKAPLAVRANVLSNLLVFLQSLDSDGDPSNGITIPAGALSAAALASVGPSYFQAAPGTFAGDATLASLVTAAGGQAHLVALVDAEAHFKRQFFAAARGAWVPEVGQLGTHQMAALHLDEFGDYMVAMAQPDDGSGGTPGIEVGGMDWNPLSHALTITIDTDTNGSNGFSNPTGAHYLMALENGKLVVRDQATPNVVEVTLVRAPDSGTGIVGTWMVPELRSLIGAPVMVSFFGDGTYLMADPAGDLSPSACGDPGVEYGSYAYNGTTLTVSAAPYYDTNGCAGLYDSVNHVGTTATVRIGASGAVASFQTANMSSPMPILRIQRPADVLPALTEANLRGAWAVVDAAAPNTPISAAFAYVDFRADGSYVFGETGTDPNCKTDYQSQGAPAASYADGNNGSEYGYWGLDLTTNMFSTFGVIRETDGSCGLYNAYAAEVEKHSLMRRVDANTIAVTSFAVQDGGFNETNSGLVAEQHFLLKRIVPGQDGFAGAWLNSTGTDGLNLVLPFSDGSYFYVDTSSSNGGVEHGVYSLNAARTQLTTDLSTAVAGCVDTTAAVTRCTSAPGTTGKTVTALTFASSPPSFTTTADGLTFNLVY
jgi:hypothetical protein